MSLAPDDFFEDDDLLGVNDSSDAFDRNLALSLQGTKDQELTDLENENYVLIQAVEHTERQLQEKAKQEKRRQDLRMQLEEKRLREFRQNEIQKQKRIFRSELKSEAWKAQAVQKVKLENQIKSNQKRLQSLENR